MDSMLSQRRLSLPYELVALEWCFLIHISRREAKSIVPEW